MEIVYANETNFEEEIKTGKVLLDFYADWCGPCQQLSPILENISKKRDDFKIIKIDVDNFQDIAGKYGVMSMPTLILLQDGNNIDQKIGLLNEEALLTWIDSK